MGRRFRQREDTIHLAIELIDRYFLLQSDEQLQRLFEPHSKMALSQQTLIQITCFLIASKFDELDENIPLIKDLIRYFTRSLPTNMPTPSHNEVVECERVIMKFFNWSLMIVSPTSVLRSLLANGVLFDSEDS